MKCWLLVIEILGIENRFFVSFLIEKMFLYVCLRSNPRSSLSSLEKISDPKEEFNMRLFLVLIYPIG